MNIALVGFEMEGRAAYAVVLSPSFASFDTFKKFEERGLELKTAVE